MSDIRYETMRDPSRSDIVIEMMHGLYAEDAPASGELPRDFRRTVDYLLAYPDRGRIVLFVEATEVRGYAILIPFWSNEMGGVVATVDELFVVPESRGQGIARRFFESLESNRPFDAVAVFLEVSPSNEKARRLYESLGFRERSNRTLARLSRQ